VLFRSTEGPARHRPWFKLEDGRDDGAVSDNGRVMGTYVHGAFASDAFRATFLSSIHADRTGGAAYEAGVDNALDALAAHLESCLDLDALLELTGQ